MHIHVFPGGVLLCLLLYLCSWIKVFHWFVEVSVFLSQHYVTSAQLGWPEACRITLLYSQCVVIANSFPEKGVEIPIVTYWNGLPP